MQKRFENQIAVITGGADGIGKGIAELIASEGGKVILFDRNESLLSETVENFKRNKWSAEGQVVDVSNEENVKNALDHTYASYGKLDIMVHAAGVVGPTNTKITEYTSEHFANICDVNLKGSFLMTKYAVGMMEKNNYGRILLLASIAGKEGNPGMVGYSASKAGVIGLVKAVGKEYAETGITVNGLAPAVISTAMNMDTNPEQLAYMTSKIPMKRLGTVAEAAAVSAWIVSREASFTTGFIYDLSGGRATY